MRTIKMMEVAGDFAEDKDLAREIRLQKIEPALRGGESVVIDFSNVRSATQSFVHALISDVIRMQDGNFLDKIKFKNCNKKVKTIITIVYDYVQDSMQISDNQNDDTAQYNLF